MRIGYGYDAHRFMEGNHIMLGGVSIAHTHGIKAHSDGDVLLHAIGDALLGAAALGDLGRHFPETGDVFCGMSSSKLLEHIMRLITDKHYKVGNVDTTVIAEQPKLLHYIERMNSHIAKLLNITVDNVNVKATTNEKMGWIGRQEGIAAQAVVLLLLENK